MADVYTDDKDNRARVFREEMRKLRDYVSPRSPCLCLPPKSVHNYNYALVALFRTSSVEACKGKYWWS